MGVKRLLLVASLFLVHCQEASQVSSRPMEPSPEAGTCATPPCAGNDPDAGVETPKCATGCAANETCSEEGTCAIVACIANDALVPVGALDPTNACRRCGASGEFTTLDDGTACGDGMLCAAGSCGARCAIAGVLYDEGARDPSNPCQACATATSSTAWTARAIGAECGTDMYCAASGCQAGCSIDGAVIVPDTLQPTNDCFACLPATSSTAWTMRENGSECGAPGQVCTAGHCGPSWHQTTSTFTGHLGSAASAADGRIYLFGGEQNNEVYRLDPTDNGVSQVATSTSVLYRSSAVRVGNLIYVMGGSIVTGPGTSTDSDIVQAFDPATSTFSPRAPMPTGLSSFSATAGLDGKIYVFGTPPAVSQYPIYVYETAYTYIYDPVGDAWTSGKKMPTFRQSTQAVTLTDGRILVVGGNTGYLTGGISDAAEIYSPALDEWTTAAPVPEPVQLALGALMSDGRVVVSGGIVPTSPYTVSKSWIYTSATNQWRTFLGMSESHLYAYATRTDDGRIYAISGRNGTTTSTTTIDILY